MYGKCPRRGYMRILITNDDGITAKGINTLFNALSDKHEVYIIAPSQERSACSNAITMMTSLVIKKIDPYHYSVTGYPADCVNIGMHANLIPAPDLILSGINHGPNMGDDIYYSGTVAGARVGRINGKSGIAVSLCENGSDRDFENAACFTAEFIMNFRERILRESVFLNINYPIVPSDEIKGVAYTFLDKRRYIDHYTRITGSEAEWEAKLEGIVESEYRSGSDTDMTRKGFISITPLNLDTTDYQTRAELGKMPQAVSI